MKLSEIKGERALDVIVEITDPIINIASDPKTKEVFKKGVLPEGVSREEYGASRLREMVPFVLKTHRSDAIAIVAAVNGVSAESYMADMTLASITRDALDLISDSAFTSLFTSAQTDRSSSGSAQATTEDPQE